MQGSLILPQRLSLQSFASLHSYRTFGIRSVGSCSFPRWQALGFGNPRAANSALQSICRSGSPLVVHDLLLQGTVTAKGLTFGGNTGRASMRGSCFAATPSCSYKAEVSGRGLHWAIDTPGKSCGSVQKSSYRVPKTVQVQQHTAFQWPSLHTQRGYARKPFGRVAGKAGGQEVILNEEDFEFRRIVSESDSITTFYSSDISPSGSGDKVEEDKERTAEKEKKTIAAHSQHADIDDGEKGKDFKKSKKVKSLQKSDGGKKTMKKGEIVEKCEDSDSESDSESDDEPEEFLQTKEEKKAAKADKDILKAIIKDGKEKRKDAKKIGKEIDGDKKKTLDYKQKNDHFDRETEDVQEGEHIAEVKTEAKTELLVNEDLATDSDEEDDGVTDFADDAVEDDENFVITEDQIAAESIENELADEIEEELDELDEDDDFWDDDEGDVVVGDGGTGGGVVLEGTEWGKNALDLAEQVVAECGKDLSIFAFKVSPDGVVRVRLDKLSDRYGSPTMTDIEVFSKRFTIALEEFGEAGTMPKDIDVEVSSPGAERVVRVPDDLERFKELPMYVQYMEGETDQNQKEGVLELDSLDEEAGLSIWKIANVRLNREVKGKGRPLNSKQKKWRATVPFPSLKQVRLYLDV